MKRRILCTILLIIALTVLLTVSVSAGGTEDFTPTGNVAEVKINGTMDYDEASEVLRLTNEARAAEGLPPLVLDPHLTESAMLRAAECAVYYSHTRPNGRPCFSILSGAYGWSCGENIAAGYDNAAAVTDGWLNSPGHRANIMYAFDTIGVGCFRASNGTLYWVQMFSTVDGTGSYSVAGKQACNVTVTTDDAVLLVNAGGYDCDGIELHVGQKIPFQVTLDNAGWGYAPEVPLVGGYTVTSSNPAVLAVETGNQIKVVKAGTATLKISFAGTGNVTRFVPVTVQKTPVLTHKYDNEDAVLTWTGSPDLILFYKEKNDDIWTYGGSGNTYRHTNYYTDPGEVYTYQLRYWNGEDYVNIGKAVTKDAPVSYLNTPQVKGANVIASGNPKLTWTKVPGAVKYRIYRAIGENGSLELYKTVTSTSFTDTGAAAGKLYRYSVEAVAANGVRSYGSSPLSRYKKLAQPKVTAKNVASSGKVKLTWEKVAGASRYEVWRAASKNGTYTKLGTTTGTSFTNTSAKAGIKYYYKVYALHSNTNSKSFASAVVSRTCDLAQPKVTVKNVASSGKIKLTWEKVAGATKYEVYRATSQNGTYKRMMTTTGTTYTNTSANAGTKYYYKVRAICNNENAASVYSAVVSRTCDLAQPKVTAATVSATGKVKLTWKAVEGAAKYEVYRATSKNGEYTKLGTTTKTSFTNTSAKAGKTYYYKVKAIHTNSAANSVFSAVVSKTGRLARPDVTVTRNSAGKPKLRWEAVTGAVEYKVYRATSKDGEYTLLGTTTKTSFTNTSAKAGKTYYYKVRAVASNTAANSAYSVVDKITTSSSSGNTASNSSGSVWIPTKGGTKYHSTSTCSGMENPAKIDKAQAVKQGFDECKKCYG